MSNEDDDGLGPDEFNEIFGDDFIEKLENVELEETTKTLAALYKSLVANGLNLLEAAAITAMLLRVMGIDDDAGNQSNS